MTAQADPFAGPGPVSDARLAELATMLASDDEGHDMDEAVVERSRWEVIAALEELPRARAALRDADAAIARLTRERDAAVRELEAMEER